MIVNDSKLTRIDEVLTALDKMPIRVWRTGSRYFGTNTDSSDYDFFTSDGTEVRNYLESIGFTENEESKYLRDLPYRSKQELATVYEAVNGLVQVQLVHKPELKVTVQEFIRDNDNLYRIISQKSKELNKVVWETAYTALSYVKPPEGITRTIPVTYETAKSPSHDFGEDTGSIGFMSGSDY